jgi:hypothetical protein
VLLSSPQGGEGSIQQNAPANSAKKRQLRDEIGPFQTEKQAVYSADGEGSGQNGDYGDARVLRERGQAWTRSVILIRPSRLGE